MPQLTLKNAINLVNNSLGANLDAADEINLVCEKYLNSCDPPGSLERVTFTVTADANGEGFITMPTRYQAIRGAVENPTSTSVCGIAIPIQNGWYEYAPGNLGMLKGTSPMQGIIPIPRTETDTLSGDIAQKYKVPVCPTQGSNSYFTCICKLAFVLLENDTDILPIQNISALEIGLMARAKRRAQDFVREDQLWAKGISELMAQKDNETGPQAYGRVQVSDDFCIGYLDDGYGSYGWGYGGWW